MKRQVQGPVYWAASCARPAGMPVGRPRGRKAAGVRFERAFGAALPEALRGQWWGFQDSRGRGHCQTDFLLSRTDGRLVVIEVKYTWTWEAHLELSRLYLPVVEKATGREAQGLVVCRALTSETPKGGICRGLGEAMAMLDKRLAPVLHWFAGGLDTCGLVMAPAHLALSRAAA